MTLRDRLLEAFPAGNSPGPAGMRLALNWTVLDKPEDEDVFRSLIERKPVRSVVEIGTYQGVSTALLAEYAEQVYTVDLIDQVLRRPLWQALGVERKVVEMVLLDNREKALCVAKVPDFNLAFIDGNHAREECLFDFELVRRSGRVIFHDEDFIGVSSALKKLEADGLKIERRPPFAYWEKN